jgi:hypothetical protein
MRRDVTTPGVVTALLVVVVAAGGASCATPNMTPSAAVTTTVQGWEHYFRLEWTAAAAPAGTGIEGYIYNTHGSPAGNVRLLAQALDERQNVIAQRIEWVPGVVPNFNRSYFRIPPLPPAAQYRVSVWSFDVIDSDVPWRRRF